MRRIERHVGRGALMVTGGTRAAAAPPDAVSPHGQPGAWSPELVGRQQSRALRCSCGWGGSLGELREGECPACGSGDVRG